MAKNEVAKPREADADTPATEAAPAGAKANGHLAKILGLARLANPQKLLKLPRKLQLIAGGAALAIVLLIGGATFFFSGSENAGGQEASDKALPVLTAAFFDLPDVIVNIQSADGSAAYLKLSVALELDGPEAKTAVEPMLPRIIDQFQTYLRELRIDDLRGSAGVMRLKEELLRRVNLAAAPISVHDVLLKEMIVQ